MYRRRRSQLPQHVTQLSGEKGELPHDESASYPLAMGSLTMVAGDTFEMTPPTANTKGWLSLKSSRASCGRRRI
jgi:hypothetical protein